MESRCHNRRSREATWIDDGRRDRSGHGDRARLRDPGCSSDRRALPLKPHCTIESSDARRRRRDGPSAHLRPDCELGDGCPHRELRRGEEQRPRRRREGGPPLLHRRRRRRRGASFGCGSVVVNYDGKSRSTAPASARGPSSGCNVNLIAPVEVEPTAFVAAGSTITKDVPERRARRGAGEAAQHRRLGAATRRRRNARLRGPGGS